MRKAAEKLAVTQPPLTRSIAKLEAHFGRPLLVRSAQGVKPTSFGLRVLESINRLTRQWELAEADLVNAGLGTTGRLRLRAGPLWRSVVLPIVITQLLAEYPGITVDLKSAASRSTLPDLVEGRVDVVFGGIHIGEGPEHRLVRRQFTTVFDRIVARENHPLFDDVAEDGLRDPLRVLDFPWIVYTANPVHELVTIHGTIERLGRAPDIRIWTESLIAILGFLQKGDYLCVLPDAAVAHVTGPRIFPVPVAFDHRTIQSGAIVREEMSDWPPLVRLFTLCEAHFAGSELSAP